MLLNKIEIIMQNSTMSVTFLYKYGTNEINIRFAIKKINKCSVDLFYDELNSINYSKNMFEKQNENDLRKIFCVLITVNKPRGTVKS